MNKHIIRNFQIFSIIFTFVFGTLLHFTYELSGDSSFIATFSAINESVWEHLKLLFFPMLLTIIIGYFYIGKTIPNFLCSKTLGIVVSMLFIIIFFYTYSGVLGKNIAIIDIASFFIATILGEYIAYKIMNTTIKCNYKIALLTLILLVFCFVFFTFSTPKLGIFKDPVTAQYGISTNKI